MDSFPELSMNKTADANLTRECLSLTPRIQRVALRRVAPMSKTGTISDAPLVAGADHTRYR